MYKTAECTNKFVYPKYTIQFNVICMYIYAVWESSFMKISQLSHKTTHWRDNVILQTRTSMRYAPT